MTRRTTTMLAAALTLGAAPTASADTLVAPEPGARNLASGGGWLAWAARAEGGGWQLRLRSPDGTVSTPDIPRFSAAPDPSIGTEAVSGSGPDRRLLVVYSRNGDIVSFSPADGREAKVAGASSRSYRETAPSIVLGRLTFVRRGGRRNGLHHLSGGRRVRRISSATPAETVQNGSRVAYTSGRNVIVRRISGRGPAATLRSPSRPFSLVLTRYQLSWAIGTGTVYRTPRFGGSGDVALPTSARASSRRLPATTNSIALSGTDVRWFLDAEGVKRVEPALFTTRE
jgi:hypothetical protein